MKTVAKQTEATKTYYTDDIDAFIALNGFSGASGIVARTLNITLDQARKRVEFAQKHRSNNV